MAARASIPSMTLPSDRREVDARVGMIVFLASWGMVFLTLFFAYGVLRLREEVWPPPGQPPMPSYVHWLGWANTLLIVASSLALHRGVRAFRSGRRAALKPMLAVCMLLGSGFLALQLHAWVELWRSGITITDGTYQGLFYAITTFHGLHVLAGLALLIWVLPIASTEGAAPSIRSRIRLDATATFWHFVDVAWLATFVVVYLL